MPEILIDHLRKYITLNDAALRQIMASFTEFDLPKKQFVVKEGDFVPIFILWTKAVCASFISMTKGWNKPSNLPSRIGG